MTNRCMKVGTKQEDDASASRLRVNIYFYSPHSDTHMPSFHGALQCPSLTTIKTLRLALAPSLHYLRVAEHI